MDKQRIKCTRCGRRITVIGVKKETFICPDCAAEERRQNEALSRNRNPLANKRLWWTEDNE